MEMEVDGDAPAPPRRVAPPAAFKCPYCPLEFKDVDQHVFRAHRERHGAGRSVAPTAFQCREVPAFRRGACCSSILTAPTSPLCSVRTTRLSPRLSSSEGRATWPGTAWKSMTRVRRMLGFGCALWLDVELSSPVCPWGCTFGGSTQEQALSQQAAAMIAPG